MLARYQVFFVLLGLVFTVLSFVLLVAMFFTVVHVKSAKVETQVVAPASVPVVVSVATPAAAVVATPAAKVYFRKPVQVETPTK